MADAVVKDRTAVAKSAGQYGIRYRTNAALEAFLSELGALSQAGAGGVVVSTDMVNAAWNEAKTRRMTGLPTDFHAVLEAALAASPSAGEDDHHPDFDDGYQWVRDASRATPPAPTTLSSLEAAEILYERHRDRCRGHHGKRIMPAWKDALPETQALYREDIASLTAPTQGDGEPGEGMAEMGEIARIVGEWRHGPMLSPEALRQIAAVATPSSPASSPSPAGGVREAAIELLSHLKLYDFIERDPSGELHDRMYDLTRALSSPATGEVVDKEAYDNMVAWMSMNAPYRHMMTFRAVLATLNPAPGHGEGVPVAGGEDHG